MTRQEVQAIVADYLELFPNERDKLRRLTERLQHKEQFNHRKSFSGHGTGGALVLSPDRTKLLFVYHKFLDDLIQPGGHWDPEDPTPWAVAQREAEEETGVVIDKMLPVDPSRPYIPIDIDTHDIKARPAKDEPEHYHHDFRYVFVAKETALKSLESEVSDCVWIPLDDPVRIPPYFQPIIEKMRHAQIIS